MMDSDASQQGDGCSDRFSERGCAQECRRDLAYDADWTARWCGSACRPNGNQGSPHLIAFSSVHLVDSNGCGYRIIACHLRQSAQEGPGGGGVGQGCDNERIASGVRLPPNATPRSFRTDAGAFAIASLRERTAMTCLGVISNGVLTAGAGARCALLVGAAGVGVGVGGRGAAAG